MAIPQATLRFGRWAKKNSEIHQREQNAIHRTILGVETSTRMSAVRHEPGVKNQPLRANIASLKLQNYILSTPESRLIHRVYKTLLWDPKKETMHIENGAKRQIETSPTAIGWAGALGKETTKKAAKE